MDIKDIALLPKVIKAYNNGANIMQMLKDIRGTNSNSYSDILISYDLQAGAYVKAVSSGYEKYDPYYTEITDIIEQYGPHDSILDVGCGEATTLANIIKRYLNCPDRVTGVDISWSRLHVGKHYVNKLVPDKNVELVAANMSSLPFPDNAFDCVITVHAIEPNGSRERELLEELLRVTKRHLILFEPAYDMATSEAQDRMVRLGYCIELLDRIQEMGLNVLKHSLLTSSINPLNPTGVTVISKNGIPPENPGFVCPVNHYPLKLTDNFYFSKDAGIVYPVLKDIPVLLPNAAVMATNLATYDPIR